MSEKQKEPARRYFADMQNDSLHSRYLSAGEVGDILGINLNTVLVWARKGIIPCLRLSRSVIRFDMEKVEAALRERAAQSERSIVNADAAKNRA